MGTAPENSLKSINEALKAGVDGVEFDVWYRGGRLICSHDGPDRDPNFNKMPTLERVLDTIGKFKRQKPVTAYIELKGPETAEPVAKIIKKYLKSGWKTSDFIIVSFQSLELERFRKMNASIAVHLNMGVRQGFASRRVIKKAVALAAAAIQPSRRVTTKGLVKAAHAAGLKVVPYHIRTTRELKNMVKLGVDGVIVDFPAKAKEILRGQL